MPEIYRVSDVDAAIELASALHKDGKYDLFRGQVRAEWLPHSSLMRLQMRNLEGWKAAFIPRFERFCHWLKGTQGLTDIYNDVHSLYAVAQHYGLPTHYLDFTTDPAVAGFFAAGAEPQEPGTESCIFCLDSADLLDTWETIRTAMDPERHGIIAPLELVRVNVDNLWRLQAQAGLFLYAPTNWEVHYPMDRIVFPYCGYPSYPTKRDIYPDRKSQLELLLDQFFDNERKLEHEQWMRGMYEELRKFNPNVSWTEANDRPLGYLPQFVRQGSLDMHESWAAAARWREVVVESYHEVARRDVPLAIDLSTPASEISNRVTYGVRRALERDPSLRKHAVTWRVEAGPGIPVRPAYTNGLVSLWDGLRRTPLGDTDLARALGTWVGLCRLGFDEHVGVPEQTAAFSELVGESLRIECGSADGASAIARVSVAGLQSALRPDLAEVLDDEVTSRAHDLNFLLQVVTSPQRLFDFDKLVVLFATEVAPSQMARIPPHFFHPARLSVLGLP